VTGEGPGVGRLATAVVGVSLSKKKGEDDESGGSCAEECRGGIRGVASFTMVGERKGDGRLTSRRSRIKESWPWSGVVGGGCICIGVG
jgi:hypothetical protein